MSCEWSKVMKVHRVSMAVSDVLMQCNDYRNGRGVGVNLRSKSGIVCMVVRGGTEWIGAWTWGTSISVGQSNRCGFGENSMLNAVCQVG